MRVRALVNHFNCGFSHGYTPAFFTWFKIVSIGGGLHSITIAIAIVNEELMKRQLTDQAVGWRRM